MSLVRGGAVGAAILMSMLVGGSAVGQILPEGEVGAVQAAPEVIKLVPKNIKDRGTLLVATMTKYQPYSFVVDGKLVGMIPEMVTAVAQAMGLKAEITPIDFPSILLGLEAKRYDIGMGEYFVRTDRLKVADFVTEWSNYNAFVVNNDSTYLPKTIADVCGHKIAILAGSSGVPAMEVAKKKCAEANQPAPDVSSFPVMADAVLALSSRRVEAVLTGREVGLTLVKSGQPFLATGRVGGGPTATAVARTDDDGKLAEAVRAAYLHLIATGTYAKIHKRWGTDYGMIDNPTIYRLNDAPPTYAN